MPTLVLLEILELKNMPSSDLIEFNCYGGKQIEGLLKAYGSAKTAEGCKVFPQMINIKIKDEWDDFKRTMASREWSKGNESKSTDNTAKILTSSGGSTLLFSWR
jgi:hypothetical protein